ncbi:MAG: phosphoglucosamine mutase, partial [Candidatus Zixiibacteriota bacterium]
AQWNALKFFNHEGEFFNQRQFNALESTLSKRKFAYQEHDNLGMLIEDFRWMDKHIRATTKLPGVSDRAVKRRKFRVVVDAVNGAGSYALPELAERLGCKVFRLNCEQTGIFPRTPEPTAENLKALGRAVKRHKADLGLACDPDADRLALVDENGKAIGEELTLAIAIEQVLSVTKTNVAINLSTSRATADVARRSGASVFLSRVGEANVVAEMKKRGALIGGEGNGGVIYGAFHYGRDSLVGAALVLSALIRTKSTLSELAGTIPRYYTTKSKAALPGDFDSQLKRLEKAMKAERPGLKVDRRDGIRFDFDEGWLLIRKSNTEPIYRLVVETTEPKLSADLHKKTKKYFT